MEFKELRKKFIENLEKLILIDKNEFKEKNIEKLKGLKNEIEKNLTFKILCLGDFSSGKTTFINNFFLEEPLLPVKATPTTAKLTVIRYSDKKIVEVLSNDKKIVVKNNIKTTLEKILTENPDPRTIVYINYPSKMLKEGIEVIDSPGLNDPDEEKMELTYRIIDNVDCVLYFLTAHQAWKRSEKEFLEKKILSKQHLDKIIFVMTYWDLVSENEKEELLAYVKEQMKKSLEVAENRLFELTGKKVKLPLPHLIPISAKTGENFEKLKKELWEFFNSIDKAKILQSKIRIYNSFIDEYILLLKVRKESLSKTQKELEQRLSELQRELEKYKKEINEIKDRLETRLRLIYKNFISNLEVMEYEILNIFQNNLQNKFKRSKNKLYNLSKDKLKEKIKEIIRSAIYETSITMENNFIEIQKKFLSEILEVLKEEKSRLKLNKSMLEKPFPNVKEIEFNDFEFQKMDLLYNITNMVGAVSAIGTAVDGIEYIVISSKIAGQGFIPWLFHKFFNSSLLFMQSITSGLFFVGILTTLTSFGVSIWLKNKHYENFERTLLDISEEIKEKLKAQIDEWIFSLRKEEDVFINTIIKGIHNSIIESYHNKIKEIKKIMELKEKNVREDYINKIIKELELLKL